MAILSEHDLDVWGKWVLATCLLFGAEFETACDIAKTFVRGLRREIVS